MKYKTSIVKQPNAPIIPFFKPYNIEMLPYVNKQGPTAITTQNTGWKIFKKTDKSKEIILKNIKQNQLII